MITLNTIHVKITLNPKQANGEVLVKLALEIRIMFTRAAGVVSGTIVKVESKRERFTRSDLEPNQSIMLAKNCTVRYITQQCEFNSDQ